MARSERFGRAMGLFGLALLSILPPSGSSLASDGSDPAWARLQVFDTASGSLLFDSGVVRASELARRAEEIPRDSGPLSFEIWTWTADGRMVGDRASGARDSLGIIDSIDFESITAGTTMTGGPITLDGPVETTQGLSVAGALSSGTFEDGGGSSFFDACASGSAVRALNADGTVVCESVATGGGDNLGDHLATQNLRMAGFWVSNDGDSEGVMVSSAGAVGLGVPSPVERLEVQGNVRLSSPSNVYFGPGTATRMTESVGNLTLSAHLNSSSDIELNAEDNVEIESDDDIFILPDDDLFIEPLGGVGFGDVNNPDRLITVEQGTSKDPIADVWEEYSSSRWKTDIRPIENALELLDQLQGVRYRSLTGGETAIGLIAEQVGQVLPEVVTWEEDGEWARSIAYSRLVAVLIEAGKEQSRRIEKLESQVESLSGQVREQTPTTH